MCIVEGEKWKPWQSYELLCQYLYLVHKQHCILHKGVKFRGRRRQLSRKSEETGCQAKSYDQLAGTAYVSSICGWHSITFIQHVCVHTPFCLSICLSVGTCVSEACAPARSRHAVPSPVHVSVLRFSKLFPQHPPKLWTTVRYKLCNRLNTNITHLVSRTDPFTIFMTSHPHLLISLLHERFSKTVNLIPLSQRSSHNAVLSRCSRSLAPF